MTVSPTSVSSQGSPQQEQSKPGSIPIPEDEEGRRKKVRKESPSGGGEETWAQLGLLTKRMLAQSPDVTPVEHCAPLHFLGGF